MATTTAATTRSRATTTKASTVPRYFEATGKHIDPILKQHGRIAFVQQGNRVLIECQGLEGECSGRDWANSMTALRKQIMPQAAGRTGGPAGKGTSRSGGGTAGKGRTRGNAAR